MVQYYGVEGLEGCRRMSYPVLSSLLPCQELGCVSCTSPHDQAYQPREIVRLHALMHYYYEVLQLEHDHVLNASYSRNHWLQSASHLSYVLTLHTVLMNLHPIPTQIFLVTSCFQPLNTNSKKAGGLVILTDINQNSPVSRLRR